MEIINLYEAKTNLSSLVERAAAGEEIIIAKAGSPRARLMPMPITAKKRKPSGLLKVTYIGDDFNDPLPLDIQKYFDGEGD